MKTRPEALRLSDCIDPPQIFVSPEMRKAAAAELRRLHALNQELVEALDGILDVYDAMGNPRGPARIIADAAIAKATGEQQ